MLGPCDCSPTTPPGPLRHQQLPPRAPCSDWGGSAISDKEKPSRLVGLVHEQ